MGQVFLHVGGKNPRRVELPSGVENIHLEQRLREFHRDRDTLRRIELVRMFDDVRARLVHCKGDLADLLVVESGFARGIRNKFTDAARESGFNDEEISKIALAVDEACTNVIKHAYEFDPSKRITITVKLGASLFEVDVLDTGRQFDPSRVLAPDMKEYLTHFRRGGLGVYLMKSLMDKVEYNIEPGKKNEVRLIKYLPR